MFLYKRGKQIHWKDVLLVKMEDCQLFLVYDKQRSVSLNVGAEGYVMASSANRL